MCHTIQPLANLLMRKLLKMCNTFDEDRTSSLQLSVGLKYRECYVYKLCVQLYMHMYVD